MREVKVLGEFYFSQIINKPIYDAGGVLIGRVKDMVAKWDSVAPRVMSIKYKKGGKDLIPVGWVEDWGRKSIRLKESFNQETSVSLGEDEIYIGKWLLDKQIVDLKGSKLVRVNDIFLSWVNHNQSSYLILSAVDIGFKGIARRLGMQSLTKNLEDHLLSWQHIEPLESKTSSLHLNLEKQQLKQLHPADIAEMLEEMDYKRRAVFIDNLDSEQAIEALTELELDTQVEIIGQMDEQKASDILEEMAPDDVADILAELSPEKSQEILELMESEDAQDVQELMNYPENTAGALMTTEFISLSTLLTADQAINRLRELAPDAETIYYLYMTDEKEVLQGVLSLRELILAAPETVLKDLMNTKIISVNHYDDERTVAKNMNKYGLLAVPVVNDENQLLGIITIDDILELLMTYRERQEMMWRFKTGSRRRK